MKNVSYVDQLSFVRPVTNVKTVARNLIVGARLQSFWKTWENLGAGPKVLKTLKQGYILPFRILPNLARSPTVISCCANPHRNLYLLEALHQLMAKNTVQSQKSLGFFNQLFLVPKPNKWRLIPDLSKLNQFLKAKKFKMVTPETIRTSLQQGEWVTSIDFRDAYFHISIQEQSRKYLRFHIQGQTYQFKALPFRLSTAPMEFTVIAKEVKLMAIHNGIRIHQYLDDWVGESQFLPNMSPKHSATSRDLLEISLGGELRQIRAGTKADLQFCRLPVQPQMWSGPTYTGQMTEPSAKNNGTSNPTGFCDPAIHVPDGSANSHKNASSPRLTAYEAHTVAPQNKLESSGITGEDHSNSQVLASRSKVVANRRQCTSRPITTPTETCSADFYRCIKRRVAHSLRQAHCRRNLVPSRKQAAYKLFGTKSSLSSLERVPRPLLRQDSSCSNRQHHSGLIHKQGRRHEVGPTLCPTVGNLDLVYQKTSDSQSPTYSRPAECGSRQAIQARPDHPDRVVSSSRGFPNNMQQIYLPRGSTTNCHCLCHRYRIHWPQQWMHSAYHWRIWTHMPSH